MNVLFLSRWYPYPPSNGSRIRVFGLLRALCSRHRVTLISFLSPDEQADDHDAVDPGPAEVFSCPYRDYQPQSMRAVRGYFGRTPRFLVDTHSQDMEDLIRDAVRRRPYDLVIASQIDMAAYHRAFQGIPAVFEEAELGIHWPDAGHGRVKRMRQQLTWSKHRRFMSDTLRHFRMCTVASDRERQLLERAVPDYRSVRVVPNSIDMGAERLRASEKVPASLIFAGSLRYAPNHDAVTWFLSDIFPLIRQAAPDVCLTVTGDPGTHPPEPQPGFVLAGRVADVRQRVAQSAVSIAPIRSGGGTRLKILEAMALGTPVVATTKAAEGLEVQAGQHLVAADTATEFAEAVVRLLSRPRERDEMAERAWNLCQDRYDSQVVGSRFLELIEQVSGDRRRTA